MSEQQILQVLELTYRKVRVVHSLSSFHPLHAYPDMRLLDHPNIVPIHDVALTNDNELFEFPFELENNMGAENPAAAMEGILTKFPLPPGNTLPTLQLDPRSELGWYRFVWYNPTELDEQQGPPELVPASHSSTNPSDIKIDTPEPASDFEETRNFWQNQPLIATK